MTDERFPRFVPPAGTPPEGVDPDQPPLHLRENAERGILYQRLYDALHNARQVRLVEVDTEEFEAIKAVAEADTAELTTFRVPPPKTKDSEREPTRQEKLSAKRLKDYEQRHRPVENVKDMISRRPGSKRSSGRRSPGK